VKFILVSIGQCIAFIDSGWNGAKASKYGNSGSKTLIIGHDNDLKKLLFLIYIIEKTSYSHMLFSSYTLTA